MTMSVNNRQKCTGCGACRQICPKNAISMKTDRKGFLYPQVNIEKCVDCGLCKKVCHLENPVPKREAPLRVCAAKNRSDDQRRMSSSGGLFLILADHVISHGGVVYGAAFDADNAVRHIRAETIEEAGRCCQSKYVQSNCADVLDSVLSDLRSQRQVLFTGTPCQVAGLCGLLKARGIPRDGIILMDFVCHGTPSPKVFQDFLRMLGDKYHRGVRQFFFRDKSQGWRGNSYKAVFEDGSASVNGFYLRGYNKLFPLSTNAACFECPYASPKRVSDITIGDFWGIEHTAFASFEDKLGVSMVLVNTEKGEAVLDAVKASVEVVAADIEDCRTNTPLFAAPEKIPGCEAFWAKYLDEGYARAFNVFCKFTGRPAIKERLKWIIMYKMNLKNTILRISGLFK